LTTSSPGSYPDIGGLKQAGLCNDGTVADLDPGSTKRFHNILFLLAKGYLKTF
jgi:hypothetical protein